MISGLVSVSRSLKGFSISSGGEAGLAVASCLSSPDLAEDTDLARLASSISLSMAPARGLLLLTDLARLPEAEPEVKVWYTRDR